MENQELLQYNPDNSSLQNVGQQQGNPFSSDLLQSYDLNLNRSGSFSDRIETLASIEIKTVEDNKEIHQNLFGATSNFSLEDGASVTGESALNLATTSAKKQLKTFASDEEFLDKMSLAFGDDWHPQKGDTLIQDLANGKTMPKIEIPATKLNGNGAFGEGTIYLSEKFLSENATDPEAVTNVLLEEIGHYIDRELNSIDSPGDEGDIFSRLVRDENINEAELGELKTENDSGIISLNGKETLVELAAPSYPGYLFQYEPGQSLSYDVNVEAWQQRMKDRGWDIDIDGLYGPQSESIARQFQQEKGLDVDGIVGRNTWEATFRTDNVTNPSPPSRPPSKPTGSFKNDIVNIAYQEWETFDRGALKETEEGAWQRVSGEYWQTDGIDRTDIDTSAEVGSDDNPWSAAFISWVIQQAGAGDRFEYNASHSYYIEDAIEDRKDNDPNAAFFGYKLDEYSPKVSDLVSYSRQDGVGYNTPAPYKSHSDIVVAKREGEIDVIGGNVSDSVTLKTLKTDSEGRLIDTSYDWFAVLSNQIGENATASPPSTQSATPSTPPPYPGYNLIYDPNNPNEYDEDPKVVKLWQQQMLDLGYEIEVDGYYGKQSAQVAKQFQADKGLEVDGYVGPITWEASFKAKASSPPSSSPIEGVTPDPLYPEYSGEQTANSDLSDRMKSFLDTIAYAEGTYRPEGYRIIVGYDEFTDFSDHPRQYVSEVNSTAAGRYQFIKSTWDETKSDFNLPDFSPKSQDLGAVDLISDRGAVDEVEAGDFEDAVSKVNRVWASLPGSPYGQPTKELDELQAFYGDRLAAYGVA